MVAIVCKKYERERITVLKNKQNPGKKMRKPCVKRQDGEMQTSILIDWEGSRLEVLLESGIFFYGFGIGICHSMTIEDP